MIVIVLSAGILAGFFLSLKWGVEKSRRDYAAMLDQYFGTVGSINRGTFAFFLEQTPGTATLTFDEKRALFDAMHAERAK